MKEACPANCPCEPTDWRNQIISLTALEEVEIDGFEGDDHEYDLLKLILGCAPMLRRMSVKLSPQVTSRNRECTKVYDMFKPYSSVECLAYLSSGKYFILHASLEYGVELSVIFLLLYNMIISKVVVVCTLVITFIAAEASAHRLLFLSKHN